MPRRSDLSGLPRRIVVTGASGHLGGWIVAELVRAGCAVAGTVGPGEDPQRTLSAFAAAGVDVSRLRILRADLAADAGWREAMAGQDALVHVAAPIPMTLPDGFEALVPEARRGMRRVLAAAAAEGVRRVVVTSSIMAALYDSRRGPDHVVSEADWSVAGEPMTGYALAKTEAEREAWAAAAELGLDLTVVNPAILLGPSLLGSVSASLYPFEEMLAGRVTVAPRVLMPLADARDVARLHVEALRSEAVIGERIFAVADQLWLADVIRLAKAVDPALGRLPEPRPIGDELARKLAESFSILRYLRYDIGHGRPIARGRAGELVGMRWRPMEETLADTIRFLQSRGAG